MSFGNTGGFGGFGQSSNQPSTFGGFGSNANTSSGGFGTNNAAGGFGSSNNNASSGGGGGLFGGGGSGAFGSNTATTGFGNNTANSAFGAKSTTPFGTGASTASGGLFGSNNQQSATASGFGGFGSNTTNTSTAFGGSGGLFGNKTFGQPTTTASSSSLFGGGNSNTGTSSFGGGFGATNNPGLGGNVGEPPGTNTTPFQAHSEKEAGGTGNLTNSFQNILFQDAYKKWSAEELRLTDYNQGRRYGNASGTGAFGVSNFGGAAFGSGAQQPSAFGSNTNTSGGLFGSNTNTAPGGFGNTSNGGGFGGTNTGGGLFGGQAKPATGGLFGNNTSTPQPAQSGGLFGNTNSGTNFGASNATAGGFGSNTSTGGGLFGSATQNKPGGFSFGTNTNTSGAGFGATSTGTSFGTNAGGSTVAPGGGGLFGTNTGQGVGGGGLFGNTAQQQQPQQGSSTGSFGSAAFGSQSQSSGTSLFGAAQQKPSGGLFGNPSSGTLFGNTNPAVNTSTAFGTNSNNTSTGGGLFGQKPPTTGTGLFGTAGTANQPTTTGTGLFGGLGANNPQTQQPPQGGLFQSSGQTQAKPGLFGTPQQSGGGLFGSQPNQQQSTLFNTGANQQQPQQSSFLGGSLLGASQMSGTPQQPLTASITDLSAYGNPSLFSSLGGNDLPNPGPLATPLSSKTKTRRGSILPMYKLNPASASRFVTPQKRGFGFSYSTYGTPGSPGSTASTPGSMGRSMLGSSLSRGLTKSVSSSSLRKSFSAEDSILAPGAFSASSGSRYYGNTGSVRKLVINKEMRSDLFSTPTKDKPSAEPTSEARKLSKRVSFDTSTVEALENGPPYIASIVSTDSGLEKQDPGSAVSRGSPLATDQVNGQELAIVHEEDHAQTPRASEGMDKAPGVYWMSPTQHTISTMNRVQRQSVENFTVGRDNVGYVMFRVPVDLSNIDLGEIFGGIVVLETRSATVYPNAAKKPPVGKGLNVPAAICLEQSWPRGRDKRPTGDGRRLGKHIERLKRIPDTTFVDYNQDSGVWKFNVEHFTTYGLEYEDDSEFEHPAGALAEQDNAWSTHPGNFTMVGNTERPSEDDTFEFRRKRRALPGAFDVGNAESPDDTDSLPPDNNMAFSGPRFAGPSSSSLVLSTEEQICMEDGGYAPVEAATTPSGQLLPEKQAAEPFNGASESPVVAETPGGILRARMRAIKGSATPVRLQVADGDEWMDMLQKSVSPHKRDRALLKIAMDKSPHGEHPSVPATRLMPGNRGFATSIDLMNSLFEKTRAPSAGISPGFVQWPYKREEKHLATPISGKDLAFRNSPKPTWGPDGTLVLPIAPVSGIGQLTVAKPDILQFRSHTMGKGDTGVAFLKFSNESAASAILNHVRMTQVHLLDGIPTTHLQYRYMKDLFHDKDLGNPTYAHEKLVWDLASILFDTTDPSASHEQTAHSRRRRLSKFWTDMVDAGTSRSVALAKSCEGKALASLSGHRIQEACRFLIEGRDFRLATLVSLGGTSEESKRAIGMQLTQWHDSNVLSDFPDTVRAIYEILSGNVCACRGKKGVPAADRVDSFIISRRFGFDWKQSFGLRLWYAIPEGDDLSEAILSFNEDITQDREDRPRAWYIEQGIDALWQDDDQDLRQDLLWGLLRLYANIDNDLESVLRPENSQLSPMDSRLCWQLSRALNAAGFVPCGDDSSVKADATTLSFADQLVNEGSWLEATFVLLHLSNPSIRVKAIKEHLCRFAGDLGPESGSNFNTLNKKWKVPASWIWEAQALYMRSVVRDPTAEVHCLLRAESFAAAHDTLVKKVAPEAIISRDYTGLSSLLDKFQGRENLISTWMLGGDLFRAFLFLHERQERREQVPVAVIEKLLNGLPAMRDAAQNVDMVSVAAVCEMSNTVAKAVVNGQQEDQRDASPVLVLPLTEDAHLQHSVKLGLSHFQGIMTGVR